MHHIFLFDLDQTLLNFHASEYKTLGIGDSLSSDMLGAKNAGLRSVWFMPTGDIEQVCTEYDINYTAQDFDELFKILKNAAESQ